MCKKTHTHTHTKLRMLTKQNPAKGLADIPSTHISETASLFNLLPSLRLVLSISLGGTLQLMTTLMTISLSEKVCVCVCVNR